MDKQFVRTKDAKKSLNVDSTTLRRWANEGSIEFLRINGGHRLYNIKSFVGCPSTDDSNVPTERMTICYCRVSSQHQKDDLERQKSSMEAQFPNCIIISDVASGLNFKRKGLRNLIQLCLQGKVQEVIVAHKDRLCSFGFDLIEWLLSTTNTKLTIIDSSKGDPDKELVTDLTSIIHVFSSRLNGSRSYKKSKKVIDN